MWRFYIHFRRGVVTSISRSVIFFLNVLRLIPTSRPHFGLITCGCGQCQVFDSRALQFRKKYGVKGRGGNIDPCLSKYRCKCPLTDALEVSYCRSAQCGCRRSRLSGPRTCSECLRMHHCDALSLVHGGSAPAGASRVQLAYVAWIPVIAWPKTFPRPFRPEARAAEIAGFRPLFKKMRGEQGNVILSPRSRALRGQCSVCAPRR